MKHKHGFSLFELAMVLTAIGLVAGGVVATRSLIRTSQLQSVVSEYQMYSAALQNFKGKYLAYPGDFAGATELWGEVSGGCKTGDATGTATCNGDGDSVIEFDSTHYEHIAAWRHLGLSGFIQQNYTGNTSGSSTCNIDIKAGANVPASKLKGAAWNLGSSTAGTAYTSGVGGQFMPMNVCSNNLVLQVLWLGGSLQDDNALAASCAGSQIPIMTGAEAAQIDAKFDNKRVNSGKIRGQYNNTATYQSCEDSVPTSGAYRTDATGTNCSLAFVINP